MNDEQFRALCRRMAQGDQSAMAELESAIGKKLLHAQIGKGIPPEVAKEIVNDALLDLWKTLQNHWNQQDIDFINTRRISYVFGIAVNKRKNYFARKRRDIPIDDEANTDDKADDSMTPDQVLEEVQQAIEDENDKERLISAIAQLTETQREVVRLHYIEGWSKTKIKDHFNYKSSNAVSDCLKGALRRLRKILASPTTKNAIRESSCA